MDELERKLEEALMCTVCHDIFEDPRELPCGHSMCMGCLRNLRDHSTDSPFRCPNCRRHFGPVIGISKSYTLTSIVEEFQIMRRKGGPDKNVYCDCCPDKQSPAVKTCVKCEVSLCQEHVKAHLERPAFTSHRLVKPLVEIVSRKCSVHRDEVAKDYCNESRRYVCKLCILVGIQQKMNKTLSAVHQSQLKEHLTHVDMSLQMMQHQLRESNQSIRTLREDMQREEETTKPKKILPESPLNSITVVLLLLWLMVLSYAYSYYVENQALKEVEKNLQNRINHIYSNIAEQSGHPADRHFPPLIKDEGVVMLDLDTANHYISISDDLCTARKVRNPVGYPSSPKRFHEAPQVLSAHCFHTGAHVWEVRVEGYWDIAVSYRSIKDERKSRSAFGNNPHSWSLTSDGGGKLLAYHNGKKTAASATLRGDRVAVTVDIEKGNITFASLDPPVTRLHEFKAKLTQPVCLGFGLYRVDPPSIASILKAH